MKAQLIRQFTVKSIIEAPLLGYNIEKVFNKKQKEFIRELILEAIEKDLSVLEVEVDGTVFTLEATSHLKSITPQKYGDII